MSSLTTSVGDNRNKRGTTVMLMLAEPCENYNVSFRQKIHLWSSFPWEVLRVTLSYSPYFNINNAKQGFPPIFVGNFFHSGIIQLDGLSATCFESCYVWYKHLLASIFIIYFSDTIGLLILEMIYKHIFKNF